MAEGAIKGVVSGNSPLMIDQDAHGVISTDRARMKGPGAWQRFWQQMGRKWRHLGYASSLYRQRLKGQYPLQLLGSPNDTYPVNDTVSSSILSGELPLSRGPVKTDANFWQNIAALDASDQQYAHSFNWLRDLGNAPNKKHATQIAERLTKQWLDVAEDWSATVWSADILAQRLMNWVCQAPLILSSSDLVYRSRMLTTMARQARHLVRVHQDCAYGLSQLRAATALTVAGFLLPGGLEWKTVGFQALSTSLQRFILPDGGPASRNTHDALDAIKQLIIIREAAQAVQLECPNMIYAALDRLVGFVKAMRHTDGRLVQMNGSCANGLSIDHRDIDRLITAAQSHVSTPNSFPDSGYQRLSRGHTVLVIDGGTPPALGIDHAAHAGVGAFEFSANTERLIINMGHHDAPSPLAALCRTSAAHSALVLDDRNSTALLKNGSLGLGVSRTTQTRSDTIDENAVTITHDGYLKRFKLRHIRTVKLVDNGTRLLGEDILESKKKAVTWPSNSVIRFHLAPRIKVDLTDLGAKITTPLGQIWEFSCFGGEIDIEESLSLGPDQEMQPTQQIVVRFSPINPCRWQFTEINPGTAVLKSRA